MQVNVHLTMIDDNPFQRRVVYGEIGELAERIASVRHQYPGTLGLMQVPQARVVDREGTVVAVDLATEKLAISGEELMELGWRVQLLFGHRRKRAIQFLWEKGEDEAYRGGRMPLILVSADDEMMLDSVWTENKDRRDLAEVEEAALMKTALDELQISQAELARRWGLSRSSLANRLRLLELPAEIQEANKAGQLSERQCLALAPIARLAETAPDVKWESGKKPTGWGGPIAPANYIAFVAEQGDQQTSDQIRKEAERMIEHAGNPIPKGMGKLAVPVKGAVLAEVCTGCEYKMKESCLNKACYSAKRRAWQTIILEKAAKKLNLPISTDKKHFDPYKGYRNCDLLQEAWTSGNAELREKMVLSFWADGYAVRPLGKGNSGEHVSEWSLKQDRGRWEAAVMLGFTGDPAALACAAEASGEIEVDPLAPYLATWAETHAEDLKVMKENVRSFLVWQVTDGIGEVEAMRGLFWLMKPKAEVAELDPSDPGGLAKELVKHVLGMNKAFSWSENDWAYVYWEKAAELFGLFAMGDRHRPEHFVLAGIERPDVLCKQAAWIGHWWAQHRGRYFVGLEISRYLARLEAVRTDLQGLAGGEEVGQTLGVLLLIETQMRAELGGEEEE